MLQEVHFDLQTVTPLFLAGAEQREASIRAPSFRGVMRYWLRVAAGGVIGTHAEGLKRITEIEQSVFGATDRGSPVIVRTHVADLTSTPWNSVHGSDATSAGGINYLLWAAEGRRGFVQPSTALQLTLATRAYEKEEDKLALSRAIGAFWLLVHLGGIGLRSRRGAGSLSVTSTHGEMGAFSFNVPSELKQLPIYLRNGIHTSQSLYESKNTITPSQRPSFDILRADACSIWLLSNNGAPWMTSEEAHGALGNGLSACRGEFKLQERKIFGVPVMQRSGGLTVYEAGKRLKRMASPLHLSVLELPTPERQYVGIATLFKTRWSDQMRDQDYALYARVEESIERKFSPATRIEL